MPETAIRRPVRSFVRRAGRISNAQRRALEDFGPRWLVAYRPEPVDLTALFGREAPRVLEIGFGMGEATATIAKAHPETDFLGVEVHTPGVGSLLRKIHDLGVGNVRIVAHDAVEVVTHMIRPETLAGIHIFFPDPWPKKRHHKRRLVQPEFVALLASRLLPGGYVHLATDWQPYAEHMLAVLSAEPALENTASGYAPRPAWRPQTKFERRGVDLGHGVWDLLFRKRGP